MIQLKDFGRTGHKSSRTIFGAASLGGVTQKEADNTLDLLLKYGVNHIDTAASYGEAELRIGPWMKEHRGNFFLATKTGQRTYQEAKDELHSSLEKMKTDYVDLWQMHALVNPDEWATAMGPGGVLDAFIEAKEAGLAKYLGVTGHGLAAPRMHYRSLEKYDFDAILCPYNYILMQNPTYASEFNQLLNACMERNVAVQTIKALARGPLEKDTGKHAVWYDPLDEDDAIDHSVKWVLGNPDVFLNTVGDIYLLPKVLQAASEFDKRTDSQTMESDINKFGIKPLFQGDEF